MLLVNYWSIIKLDKSLKIKDNIVKTIVDKSIIKKLVTIELDVVKDIYFDGISKYDELKDMPSQVKRILLEMPGNYPKNESERVSFEEQLIERKSDTENKLFILS